ncbi:MAG TPA: hypothetical protein VMX94_01955 [Armatimonadota bacterium]|nr:hypothetical protein [Armatimonadota bacterium]
MREAIKVRWGWLRFMYFYTIIGAGALGLGMVFVPKLVQSVLGFPREDPIVFGINGSVYVAFAILSVLGLRSPLKFAPVLLLQLAYKSVWLVGVILPLLVAGRLPAYGIPLAVVFATYIIGDLIAIPFGYVFSKE